MEKLRLQREMEETEKENKSAADQARAEEAEANREIKMIHGLFELGKEAEEAQRSLLRTLARMEDFCGEMDGAAAQAREAVQAHERRLLRLREEQVRREQERFSMTVFSSYCNRQISLVAEERSKIAEENLQEVNERTTREALQRAVAAAEARLEERKKEVAKLTSDVEK